MQNYEEFEKLLLIELDMFYRVAYAISRDSSVAEDLVQTASLKAIKKFKSFRKGTNFKAWFLRILKNTWYDELRHRKVVGTVLQIDSIPVADVEKEEEIVWTDANDLLENFSDRQIIHALAALPEDQRLTLFLVDVEQLDHSEVSSILDIPVGTVKSRSSRARSMLKSLLQDFALEHGFLERKA